MNIATVTVSAALMGLIALGVAQMSIAPVIAQKKATNFGIAESAAVVFAAQYEGGEEQPVATDVCTPTDLGNRSWQVTCEEGEGQFFTTVTRAFRLMPEDTEGTSTRTFPHDTPTDYSGDQCPVYDSWGVNGYINDSSAA